MIQGLYSAASGMIALESQHETVANNIANAATPGFKSHGAVQLGFYTMFSGKLRQPFVFDSEAAPGGGVKAVENYPDLAGGVVRTTDNPLNAALEGPGYFAIDTARGERYTRAGDFSIDAQGCLVTQYGDRVSSVSGTPIVVGGGTVNIDRDGMVMVDGVPTGQLRIVEFEAPERLMREGDNLFAASDEVSKQISAADSTAVSQSSLEMSNVSLPREMSRMMLGMRAYEANQRVIQGLDGTIGKLIDQVGMP